MIIIKRDYLKLYGIVGEESLANVSKLPLKTAVRKALEGGITCLQIREKQKSIPVICNIVYEVKTLCDEFNVPLIVNDSVMACKLTGAAGVHLGLGDTSIVEAREILGAEKIIGATAHNLHEALAAAAAGADYIGVGAAFGSTSKDDAIKVDNLSMYKEITEKVPIPVVAIGGINKDNIEELKDMGIAGVALISAIFSGEDIYANTLILKDKIESVVGGKNVT